MAEKKYLDYEGLAEVISKSKQNFQKKEFIGTAAEWALVPSADKAKYDVVNITDDNQGAPVATTSVAGIVKPDGTTIGVESDGTIKATVFTGTTGDWSQLSLAEKVKYSIVNLTDDYNQGNFQYSTVEQKTGRKWIDGKPIYCRVISGTTGTTGVDSNVVIIDNFGDLISISGSLIHAGAILPFTFARMDGESTSEEDWWVTACITRSTNGVGIRYSPAHYSNRPYNLILEYTKTTD